MGGGRGGSIALYSTVHYIQISLSYKQVEIFLSAAQEIYTKLAPTKLFCSLKKNVSTI